MRQISLAIRTSLSPLQPATTKKMERNRTLYVIRVQLFSPEASKLQYISEFSLLVRSNVYTLMSPC